MLWQRRVSFQGKTVAITGASGAMGRALIQVLSDEGAAIVALTTSANPTFDEAVEVMQWATGSERSLQTRFQTVDILIINHGVNVYGDRTPTAVQTSLQVNALSVLDLVEVFLETVQSATGSAPNTASSNASTKEIWINTSEAEVSPALSPLYELSKRLLGDLITLKRLDAPCLMRKVVLGPFKSDLNPYGVMSANRVARSVVAAAKGGDRNIIVTINPITYIAFPIKETLQALYFRLFSKPPAESPK